MNNERRTRAALIYGGAGYESEVSIRGKEHILPLIDAEKYNVIPIFIDKDGAWRINGEQAVPYNRGFFCPESGRQITVDCAFPLLHGDHGEDGSVQGALECASIPYVGCGVWSAAVCRDKAMVKTVAESLGIPTLPHLTLLREEGVDYAVRHTEATFKYPLFVKPTCLGSSMGVGHADSTDTLRRAVTDAFALSDRVIIEPYLSHKRELECGYFRAKGKELFTNPGEILHSGTYRYEDKYLSGEVGIAIRAHVDDRVRELVREYSRRLVRTLGVRDLGRIDFFLTDQELYFNEINTMPGFTDGSLYAKMITAYGMTEGGLIESLIDGAADRE
ncbi:MAG: D-alanine--D-alanine ligase [Clostridia bacterium]|nr:D-alanine--D-alanine ligase [Clostridia bacterium]